MGWKEAYRKKLEKKFKKRERQKLKGLKIKDDLFTRTIRRILRVFRIKGVKLK